MFTDINRQLDEARQGVFQLQKIDSMLQHLLLEQADLAEKAAQLKGKLVKEDADVERLEKRSLAALFYSALGNYIHRLEKERQEALAAKLKLKQAKSDLEDVRSEIASLRSRRQEYLDYPRRYDALYAQKKEMLLNSGSEAAQELMDTKEELSQCKNMLGEVGEAMAAGESVLASIDRTLNSLGSAENWGVWDVLGGGLLADLAKHSHIDDARAEADRTQRLLRHFNTELADVKIHGHFTFETGGFAKFADFFFDGLIADFVMQSKITNSRDSVARVRRQVVAVIERLERIETWERKAAAELGKRIDALVIES